MILNISKNIYQQISNHLIDAYPNEGAGFLLGYTKNHNRTVRMILALVNEWETKEQTNRYKISAKAYMNAEDVAEQKGLDLIGVFHSHPDNPANPSEYDREFALPWWSYLIISINNNKVDHAKCWVLDDDRNQFIEEIFNIK